MKKKLLIDTDILSYLLKGKNEIVTENFENYLAEHEKINVSRISVIEILGGLKAKNATKQLAHFEEFIAQHNILDTNADTAKWASEIFAQLYQMGKHSGNFDILNAAIALANEMGICYE